MPGPRDPSLTPYVIAPERAAVAGRYKRVVLMCGAQMGKALALDTPLPTPTGWTSMRAVQPGDYLLDEHGKPVRVAAVSRVMHDHSCYRVGFSDGAAIVADAGHRWAVSRARRRVRSDCVKTTAELAVDLTVQMRRGVRSKWAIRNAEPLVLPDDISLPIEPWLLGLWLGDGNSHSGNITVGKQDYAAITAMLDADGIRWRAKEYRSAWSLVIDPVRHGRACFRGRLSAAGLLCNKHIPSRYLRASESQRRAILQGLMDADGHCTVKGNCEFSTTSAVLAANVMELVRSLGLKPVLASARATLRGRDVGHKYRVRFTAYDHMPVFRLARKLVRQRSVNGRGARPTESGRRFIISIQPVASVPVKCVAVDSPTHLYLAGEAMIPTHNTDFFLDVIGYTLDQNPTPLLYVGPNRQFIVEQFEPRLMALLDEAKVLMLKVARGKRMTKSRKVVAGVPVRLAHGGSSTALKSDPASIAFVDEYDELLRNVKGQGDVLGLVEARGFTYAEFNAVIASTTSRGTVDVYLDEKSGLEFWEYEEDPAVIESAIWRLWQQGTMYHWTWRCPHCHGWFVPRFRNLKWPENSTPFEASRSAYVLCPHANCGGVIEEKHKAEMNETGVYVAPGQWIDDQGQVCGDPPESHYATFWVSGLCSPFVSFGARAEAYLTAVRSGDMDKVQTAINAGFGEMFAPGGGNAPEWKEVRACEQPYRFGQLPAGVIFITGGVDVQKNRLVYVFRGWGARAESWLLEHGDLWGPTDEADVWTSLHDMLENKTFDGMRVSMTFVDSGFRPNKPESGPVNMVYDFCLRHMRHTRPSKGSATLNGAPLRVVKHEVMVDGRKAPYSVDLVHIDTDWAKLFLHERIRWPDDQPGGWHISIDATDDYCMQIVSEARIMKPSGRASWVPRSRNNHALDCEAMAYAAGYMLNAQRIPDGYKPARPTPPAGAQPAALPGMPPPPPPQSSGSGVRFRFGMPRR